MRNALNFVWLSAIFLAGGTAAVPVRVKDLVRVQGMEAFPVTGYGLVVGLDRTGDRNGAAFTAQSVANMLQHFGISVPKERIRPRNVAAVMVTASLPPSVRPGNRVDVVVASMGDARSLEGGTLLMTPLVGRDGEVYAYAQGPISIGGFNVEAGMGERLRRNYTLVGRVPGGGMVERVPKLRPLGDTLTLVLHRPDFTTAVRIAEAINLSLFGGSKVAVASDAGTVALPIPPKYRVEGGVVELIAALEPVEVEPDEVARVVINERTGTVVVGQHVRVSDAAVAHENLTIRIGVTPVISQPLPFSRGQTVVVPEVQIAAETQVAGISALPASATVGDLAKALNALGVSPRDLIAIFQALKEAGALKAELVIM
ncbi:MAG TPA: flagellar basal body P-ring protein FlgI [Candidatus Latescibacteria bacterium]|nr:flagellar basal body P-ring protein FlgI [Candidatus Latescibacterota bacterium]